MLGDTIERDFSFDSKASLAQSSKDIELILSCQKGDLQAFNILLKRYHNYVLGILHKIAPDKQGLHEDYCQDVFLRIFQSIRTLRNPAAFRRWLYQLVCNLFYDDLRKTRGIDFVSLDEPVGGDDEQAGTREIADSRELPDALYERQEIIDSVNLAITRLPEQFKEAIELREFSGLHYDAIAKITNTDLGTVKSRIARARARMQVTLTDLQVA